MAGALIPTGAGGRPGGAVGKPGGTAGVTGAASTLGGDIAGDANTASCDPISESTATEDVGERGGAGTDGKACESFLAF